MAFYKNSVGLAKRREQEGRKAGERPDAITLPGQVQLPAVRAVHGPALRRFTTPPVDLLTLIRGEVPCTARVPRGLPSANRILTQISPLSNRERGDIMLQVVFSVLCDLIASVLHFGFQRRNHLTEPSRDRRTQCAGVLKD